MIQVLTGQKGSGKTKKMITIANDLLNQTKGHVVYISNNTETMYDLHSGIRLISLMDMPITNIDSFIGFLYGVVSEDFDIEYVLIDNLNNILVDPDTDYHSVIEKINDLSHKCNINFYCGLRVAAKNDGCINHGLELITTSIV